MRSIRRILVLFALVGAVGLATESQAQAKTGRPKSGGTATASGKQIKFVQLLLGQERQSIRQETNLIRKLDRVNSQLSQLISQAPQNLGRIAKLRSMANQFLSLLNPSIRQAMAKLSIIDRIMASIDPAMVQRSPSLARQFQRLQQQLDLVHNSMTVISTRTPFGLPSGTQSR